jgi:hypothetical protein
MVTTSAYAAGSKQILINNNIQSVESFGKYNDSAYTDFYNPSNLFDNQINTWSFWSQYGKSGISVDLKKPLDRPVCNVEIDVFNPRNTPYNMHLTGNDTSFVDYNGNLDTANETIKIDNCQPKLVSLDFTFDAPKKWTTISEIKLFSNTTTGGGPIEPPVCGPGTHEEDGQCVPDVTLPPGNYTKLNISNSTVFANITDSKLVINLDPATKVIYNNTNINEEEQEDEDEEEEEENDKN